MLFGWFKRRRRRKLLAEPFPDAWLAPLREALPCYDALSEDERRRLRDDLRIFIAEKTWTGCGGFEMTDRARVVVAAQACLLLLHLDHDYYKDVREVLMYPSTFVVPDRSLGPGGVVSEAERATLGQAWRRGPVVLAWDSVRGGAANAEDGRNLVYHEFAHKLDLLDEVADGTPPLRRRERYEAWRRVMTREYERLIEASGRGRATLLDRYGATNPAEFFAVATEIFFEQPRQMRRRHPDLYALLRDYYRQDPDGRLGD